jgi:hypothetical protein
MTDTKIGASPAPALWQLSAARIHRSIDDVTSYSMFNFTLPPWVTRNLEDKYFQPRFAVMP